MYSRTEFMQLKIQQEKCGGHPHSGISGKHTGSTSNGSLQTDSLTIVSTSAKHIDEKKKIEEKLERAAEQCSLDNQMSIFDLFPDF